jgi:hypothetical protein
MTLTALHMTLTALHYTHLSGLRGSLAETPVLEKYTF